MNIDLLGYMSDKDNLEGIIKRKMSIIWRHHLPMQRNGEGQNGIVVKIINTSNTYSGAKNAKKKITSCTYDPISGCAKHATHIMS